MEDLETPGDFTAGVNSGVGVVGSFRNTKAYNKEYDSFFTVITDVCEQELTPPHTISSLYYLLLFELRYLNSGCN